ncbi:MAG: peptide-methionine (S)-S-oxide reductase MsrA [Pseudomonadota bacterium]|nr:peptide-methionine (S)-S-oxide reductase MsrA [Pseudomonadota bacterium]
MEKATFGAGCFWGVESTFRKIDGVSDVIVGYSGGNMPDPTYESVCSGQTGHAEVVEVTFDPAQVNYDHLLEAFWSCHDPTQLNRQGWDIGTQYRSAIFYHSEEQEKLALQSIEACVTSGRFNGKIVTEISKVSNFWRAEEYHQRYLEKKGIY